MDNKRNNSRKRDRAKDRDREKENITGGRSSAETADTRKRASGSDRSHVAHNTKRKKKGMDGISLTILLVAVCVFVFSAYQLVLTLVPYYSGGEEYDKIKSLAIISDVVDDAADDVEAGVADATKFKVDFDVLMQQNPDTVAWLRFDAPEIISYPVVKSADNNEYLTKTFTANDNKLGAIFMDMRNQSDFQSRNTFIYGHNLKMGGEMFSQLNEYASEDFYKQHPNFYIYTPDGKTRTYQVFAAAVVKDTSDQYNLDYASDEAFSQYIEMCKSASNYQTDAAVDQSSSIVSLSTCTNVNDDERFLLQGVLVSEESAE